MKYLLFGTGDYYQRYKKWFCKDEVVALLDNSQAKQNAMIDGIRVLSPEEGIKLDFDRIIILSFYVKAMKQQLLELGVSEDCILHFYDLHQIINVRNYQDDALFYGNADKVIFDRTEKKKILLLSQDLTLGGPAIALLHVAEVLIKHGMTVVYGSMLDGPLQETLLEKNIPVVVDNKLQIAKMSEIDWLQDFSMILCNTINFHVFLSERNTRIPIIWWLHDSLFFYDGVKKDNLSVIDRTNLRVISVGPVPQCAIQSFLSDLEVGNLIYGVEDTIDVVKRNKTGKVCFVTIGYIEARKGQDILMEAVHNLPVEIREKAVFFYVGQDSSLMAQRIKEEIEDVPEVVVTGVVDRGKIDEILEEADVLLCPSREDPMPTVAAEAMMHSVPCIVSDVTGTAKYITEGVDGFVFESENVEELVKKIVWCIENSNKLIAMRANARRLFEKTFSMEAFERNLLDVVNDVLK